MREIKYKAWDEEIKTMCRVNAIDFDNGIACIQTKGIIECHNRQFDGHHDRLGCELKPCKLLQYTGLKDDNGREIYEGDILKILNPEWPEDETEFVEVKWCADRDYPAFDIPDSVESDECNGLSQAMNNGGIFEVVGNIYENPSLLKEGAAE